MSAVVCLLDTIGTENAIAQTEFDKKVERRVAELEGRNVTKENSVEKNVVSSVDQNKQQQKGYRLYTSLRLNNGSYIVVAAEVKNAGRDIEINSINTLFGRDSISEVHEELIHTSKNITPEQQSLLDGNNPHQYTAVQELFERVKIQQTSRKTKKLRAQSSSTPQIESSNSQPIKH